MCAPHAAETAATFATPDQLQFVPNRGQWSDGVRYGVLGDTVGWLHDDGFTLRFERWTAADERRPGRSASGAVVRTRFVGAVTTSLDGGAPLATRHHFLRGGVGRHRRDVPAFANVTMRGVLPGIDVQFRPLPDGVRGPFEYDLLLAAGADLSRFVAECEGVECLRIDEQGRLVATVATPDGVRELVQQAPVAWQSGEHGRTPVDVRFRLLGTRRYGFAARDLDAELATVVDPGVLWGTFLGGGATDRIYDVEWRNGNGGWIGGWTGSTDFPTSTGAFQTSGGADGFVAKLSDDGQSLLFATYLGGSRSEEVRGLAVADDDTVTVVGFTNSSDFPVTAGAAQPNYAGASTFLDLGDGFVARVAANGQSLLGATFLGGTFDDIAEDVVLDDNGNPIVCGWTSSPDMPVPAGGLQPLLGGLAIAQTDGFVIGAAADLQSLTFGTFLGGASGEQLLAIDRDDQTGDLAVTGWSIGADYLTTPGVVRPTSGGDIDAVLTRLDATASTAVWSTYLGGVDEDAGQTVHFDSDGSVWVGGFTDSANFPPTLNAPQTALAGGFDGFVTRVSSIGQSLVFSTLLGGPGNDRVRALDVSAAGVMVVGEAAAGFPVAAGATQPQFASGITDAFATWLSNGGTTIAWSSYFGGEFQDAFSAVHFGDSGIASLAGYSYSPDFPIAPAALQGNLLGVEDGVVVRLDLLSDLGPGLRVTPVSGEDVVVQQGGEVELLRFELENVTDRVLYVDRVRFMASGGGMTMANVTSFALLQDGQPVGGAPMVAPATDYELATNVAGSRLTIAPHTVATVTLTANCSGSMSPPAFEVGALIEGAASFDVRAFGLGGGPSVGVIGAARVTGPVYVVGKLPGDIDGSGQRDVIDLRRLVNSVGSGDGETDVDGDGVITTIDVAATRQAILGRGSGFAAPTQVARDEWLRVDVLLPKLDGLQASLGGRSLLVGRATPREITARVPADQALGLQELVISRAGQVIFAGLVEVL
ncbi:MAG: hypothetical protein ACE37K_20870 [Planctomycetota bacterium]